MPWTLNIERDPDKTDVGNVTLTFVEEGQSEPVFNISRRIQLTIAQRNAFFQEAYTARNTWRSRLAWETQQESIHVAVLNNNDPNPTP